jgi:hypothetical protein
MTMRSTSMTWRRFNKAPTSGDSRSLPLREKKGGNSDRRMLGCSLGLARPARAAGQGAYLIAAAAIGAGWPALGGMVLGMLALAGANHHSGSI